MGCIQIDYGDLLSLQKSPIKFYFHVRFEMLKILISSLATNPLSIKSEDKIGFFQHSNVKNDRVDDHYLVHFASRGDTIVILSSMV